MEGLDRLNAEWITLNAFRGLAKIASQGDMEKSTYDNALELGGELYPDLLGDNSSILKCERETNTTKEYRQKALLSSIRDGKTVEALNLVNTDISEYEDLLSIAEKQAEDKQQVDQLKRKLEQLYQAKKEIAPGDRNENKLIFSDVYNVERTIPTLAQGHAYRDFKLPDERIMRLRVLYPDKIEHITGADLIYERHSPMDETVAIVAVQYKIWEKQKLYLSDERMLDHIDKMKSFLCDKYVCCDSEDETGYRFPYCSAFFRPTDKLQKPDQPFISTGEHLPICKIDECKSIGSHGTKILEYKNIKDISLPSEMFEHLFNKGKIGSKDLTYVELSELYKDFIVLSSNNRVVIYAQEF